MFSRPPRFCARLSAVRRARGFVGIVAPVKFGYEEFDLSGVGTYPLASRKSKAHAADFAAPYVSGSGVDGLLQSMPNILGSADFKAVVEAIRAARDAERGIIWGIGAHVLKTGLSPILISLMEHGFVSAIATNGAGVIHDFELALSGSTSEDVEEALGPGRFGMAEETGRLLNGAINDGVAGGLGYGQAVVALPPSRAVRRTPTSACSAPRARLEIPVTVHVAVGTDIIHMHPGRLGRRDRRGQPARFPLLRLERREARRGRVSELWIGGRARRRCS